MAVNRISGIFGIHQNHVTIGGSDPDPWNIGKQEINGINYKTLRSFVTMFLKTEYYDENFINNILKI